MTLTELIAAYDKAGIPHDWELLVDLQVEYFHLKGISVIGQHEVGLVFEDHQRIKALNEDPEEYEVPVAY